MTPEDAAFRAIQALPHAVMVVDGADRLVLANAALWGEAGADPARVPPGTPLRDMLRLLAFRGLLGPGDPAELAAEARRLGLHERLAMLLPVVPRRLYVTAFSLRGPQLFFYM